MTWDSNPYYDPEKCGLEIVASVELCPEHSYEFDLAIVWREKATGALYFGMDSGCSCPCPFEDVRSVAELERIQSTQAIESQLRARWSGTLEGYDLKDGQLGTLKPHVQDFLNELRVKGVPA